jgi:hypothetical protein
MTHGLIRIRGAPAQPQNLDLDKLEKHLQEMTLRRRGTPHCPKCRQSQLG